MQSNNFTLSENQLSQFVSYYALLIEWNQKINLTTITTEKEVIIKHFLDSIQPAHYFSFDSINNILDIGAGAGFPSIPLKIIFPHLNVTIIDSLNKRILFLKELVSLLELKNVTLLHGRAEDFAKELNYRENFDVGMARAVARLNILSELCLPYVKIGGQLLVLKGKDIVEELTEGRKALNILGGEVEKIYNYFLPEAMGERTLLILNKIKKTPKEYPRKAGIPNKNPII